MWGRLLYKHVQCFLTYQLTMSISLCTSTVVGGLFIGHAPLNVLQMLWANLVMDLLGALALATEGWVDCDDDGRLIKRQTRTDTLINSSMWLQILV